MKKLIKYIYFTLLVITLLFPLMQPSKLSNALNTDSQEREQNFHSNSIDSTTHTRIDLDSFDFTIEDHDSILSKQYYLFEGDSIWMDVTIIPLDDPYSTVESTIHTPESSFSIDSDGDGYTGWYVLPSMDPEGNYQIEIYNLGFFSGGDRIRVLGEFWHYTNTLPTGNFLTPSQGETISGTITISWDVTDADGDDLLFDLYFLPGWNSNWWTSASIDNIFFLENTSVEWNSVSAGIPDGNYTLALLVEDFDSNVSTYSDCCYRNIIIDNINDAPIINLNSPISGVSTVFSDKVSISWSASDINLDTLRYSIYYATDGINFDNLIISNLTTNSYLWDIGLLPDGTNYAIKVIAEDEHLLSNSDASGTFTINNKEIITFLSPNVTKTNKPILNVKISTNAYSAELFVNGTSKGTQISGFEWLIELQEGLNVLTVVVVDEIGNQETKSLTIILDTSIPSSNYPILGIIIGFFILAVFNRFNTKKL